MKQIALKLMDKFTSRKFLAAAAGFTIVLLQGFGFASSENEVLAISAATVFGYPIVEGTVDAVRA